MENKVPLGGKIVDPILNATEQHVEMRINSVTNKWLKVARN